jgi:hypothetical protein
MAQVTIGALRAWFIYVMQEFCNWSLGPTGVIDYLLRPRLAENRHSFASASLVLGRLVGHAVPLVQEDTL